MNDVNAAKDIVAVTSWTKDEYGKLKVCQGLTRTEIAVRICETILRHEYYVIPGKDEVIDLAKVSVSITDSLIAELKKDQPK